MGKRNEEIMQEIMNILTDKDQGQTLSEARGRGHIVSGPAGFRIPIDQLIALLSQFQKDAEEIFDEYLSKLEEVDKLQAKSFKRGKTALDSIDNIYDIAIDLQNEFDDGVNDEIKKFQMSLKRAYGIIQKEAANI